ncbi:MAG: hypothetical protein P8X98_10760 [Woeseiaceae bacterium]|jgi:hypothetical protein
MKLRLFIAALTLGLALPVAADFVTIQQAYEVALSDVRLPQSESGTIAYKTCATCSYETRQIDASTRWLIDGKAVPLKTFREAVRRVTEPGKEAVTVLHHLETNRVTQVSVYL